MIYLGLGSNIENREMYLRQAIKLLGEHDLIRIVKKSSIYETAPFGFTDQAAFLNAVIGIESALSPQDLLAECLRIEKCLDRVRVIHWGPRTIDIDILLYHDLELTTENLTVPHPYFMVRPFVLAPLAEITDGEHIYQGKTANELLALCEKAGISVYGVF